MALVLAGSAAFKNDRRYQVIPILKPWSVSCDWLLPSRLLATNVGWTDGSFFINSASNMCFVNKNSKNNSFPKRRFIRKWLIRMKSPDSITGSNLSWLRSWITLDNPKFVELMNPGAFCVYSTFKSNETLYILTLDLLAKTIGWTDGFSLWVMCRTEVKTGSTRQSSSRKSPLRIGPPKLPDEKYLTIPQFVIDLSRTL